MAGNMIVDFHSHILPDTDDGSTDIHMTMEHMKQAYKAGIDFIVATPHFYPHKDTMEQFLKKRDSRVDNINTIEDTIPLIKGAEVLLCENIHKMERISDLCIENTNTILVEMPFSDNWSEKLIETLIGLRDCCKLNVIIAHADRYRFSQVAKLTNLGFEVQLNADSICNTIKWHSCKKYLKSGNVAAIGSDIHRDSKSYIRFKRAVRKLKKYPYIFEKSAELAGK